MELGYTQVIMLRRAIAIGGVGQGQVRKVGMFLIYTDRVGLHEFLQIVDYDFSINHFFSAGIQKINFNDSAQNMCSTEEYLHKKWTEKCDNYKIVL